MSLFKNNDYLVTYMYTSSFKDYFFTINIIQYNILKVLAEEAEEGSDDESRSLCYIQQTSPTLTFIY